MTTVRQMRAIKIVGIDPGKVTGAKPKFEWIEPDKLYVEESYQRSIVGTSIAMIRRIVKNWNWGHLKPPVCVKDSKGRLIVIDGQHTAIAAETNWGQGYFMTDTAKKKVAALIDEHKGIAA